MSFEEIYNKIAESAPLLERLDDCMSRIAKMCSERRPPKMTIPVHWNDDDVFIVATIKEAVGQLIALNAAPAIGPRALAQVAGCSPSTAHTILAEVKAGRLHLPAEQADGEHDGSALVL